MSAATPPTTAGTATAVERAVHRLVEAAATGEPCAPVRDLLGDSDVALAYRVQRELTDRRVRAGARVVGRKIGLTAPAVQAQLGVDQPDFGTLFDDMRCDGPVPTARLLQPKAEAEIAFVLAEDLDRDDLDAATVRRAVGRCHAAIEIVDSRIRDWDIRITDTVADNASSGMFVLGDRALPLTRCEPAAVVMSMAKNGVPVSRGTGADCLGDPLLALAWLAATARALGAPLRAGEVILSGALGPMVAVEPGASVTAELSTLGPVSAAFS